MSYYVEYVFHFLGKMPSLDLLIFDVLNFLLKYLSYKDEKNLRLVKKSIHQTFQQLDKSFYREVDIDPTYYHESDVYTSYRWHFRFQLHFAESLVT